MHAAVVRSAVAFFSVALMAAAEIVAGQGIDAGGAAWAPIDGAAERLFRHADSERTGFISVPQFHALEARLNDTIRRLAERGALRGIPPNALNAQTYGLTLPGAQEISQPEFVMQARSRAIRLIAADARAAVGSRLPDMLRPPGPSPAGGGSGSARGGSSVAANSGDGPGPRQPLEAWRKHHPGVPRPPEPGPAVDFDGQRLAQQAGRRPRGPTPGDPAPADLTGSPPRPAAD